MDPNIASSASVSGGVVIAASEWSTDGTYVILINTAAARQGYSLGMYLASLVHEYAHCAMGPAGTGRVGDGVSERGHTRAWRDALVNFLTFVESWLRWPLAYRCDQCQMFGVGCARVRSCPGPRRTLLVAT